MMKENNWQIPEGFTLSSGSLSLRGTDKDDCMVIQCPETAIASGVFTQNIFCGAPITINKSHLRSSGGKARAVLINTVFANAGTGAEGLENADNIAAFLARSLNIPKDQVLLASTGKIGPQLPVDKFKKHLPPMLSSPDNDIFRAANAILTTDLVPKIEYCRLTGGASILGIAKGSGMIAPNMATMLAFIVSDAMVEQVVLDRELKRICRDTFNQVSVDNCQSISDMVLVLVNEKKRADPTEFFASLRNIARGLAKQIAADGEGATHFLEVVTRNCGTKADARVLAKSVVMSDLFKAAIAGHDPNWGCICSAIGSTGIAFDPKIIDIFFDDTPVYLEGKPVLQPNISQMFLNKQVTVEINFHRGTASGRAWGCDLTKKYLEINIQEYNRTGDKP